MSIEGAAAIVAVGFAVLCSVVAVAVAIGFNRNRLDRVERDLHSHLDHAPDVMADIRQIKTILVFMAQRLGLDLPPMGDS